MHLRVALKGPHLTQFTTSNARVQGCESEQKFTLRHVFVIELSVRVRVDTHKVSFLRRSDLSR